MWAVFIEILGVMTIVCGDVNVFAPTTPPMIMEEFRDMPASFGGALPDDGLQGLLVLADPADGCAPLAKPPLENNNNTNWIALIARYNCSFETKVRNAQLAGYDCVIVHNVNSSDLETMSAKDGKDIVIPSVFVSGFAGATLASGYLYNTGYYIMVNGDLPFNINTSLLLPFAIVVVICLVVILIFMIMKCVNDRRRERRHRLPSRSLKKIPTCKFSKGDPYDTCAICLDDYQEGDRLRVLPCAHAYHAKCIDPWLTQNRRVCPCCKRKVLAAGERTTHDSDSESDDTAPLVASGPQAPTQGGTFEPQRENPFVRAARFMRLMRRQPEQSDAEQDADDAVGETPTEENEQPNINIADEIPPEDDTAPLLAPSSSSVMVAETGRRSSRRSRRRPRSAGPDRSTPITPSIPHHSINTDTVQGSPQQRGQIGVAALPASQRPPNVRFMDV